MLLLLLLLLLILGSHSFVIGCNDSNAQSITASMAHDGTHGMLQLRLLNVLAPRSPPPIQDGSAGKRLKGDWADHDYGTLAATLCAITLLLSAPIIEHRKRRAP
jgi:hypothetical protein